MKDIEEQKKELAELREKKRLREEKKRIKREIDKLRDEEIRESGSWLQKLRLNLLGDGY